ncbi:FkbM family methyltransferase [Actinosynnema sp. NPDC020468]|uniref:FkbM family methyltransferase n=1 Tax=Actinosynnema sp. NPDC020468 TaxID=3154488 RepID=UPI0033DF808E
MDLARHVPPAVRARIRKAATRAGIAITRNPFPHRLVRLTGLLGVTTVLDVGANSGQYAALLRESGYTGALVSCEPLAAPFADLRQACARDRLWSAHRVALGEREGEVRINVAANQGASSSVLDMLPAHAGAAPEARFTGVETARMTTVDKLVGELRLPAERTLLKVDVQGYEAHVLAGAQRSLKSLAAVQLELSLVELYQGQLLMDELVDALAGHDFALWGLEPGFSDPRTGRMLQCDGVFVRNGLVS